MGPRRIRRTIELSKWRQDVEQLGLLAYTGASGGHRLELTLTEDGAAANLAGYGARAYFLTGGAQAVKVIAGGQIEGNVVRVTFPAEAYAAGMASFVVMAEAGEAAIPLYAGSYIVHSASADVVIDPGNIVPDLTQLLAQIEAMKTATAAASGAAEAASAQATSAKNAAEEASAAAGQIEGMTVSARTIAAGSAATAAISDGETGKHIEFGVPAGVTPRITFTAATGEPGTDVVISQSGTPEAPSVKLTIPRGKPGTGHVSSVCKVEPGEDGDVRLELADIPGGLTGQADFGCDEIVTIRDAPSGVGLDVISEIAVTQEGSGTPSADNVRAFVPWTNATLDVAGVNLIPWAVPGRTFNGNGMTGEIDADGAVINGNPTNNYAQLNYQSALLRPGTYTPNGGESNKFYFNLYLLETLGGSAIGTSNYGGKVVTLDEPTNVQVKMQAATVESTGTLENYRLAPMLTLADQALADGEFVPYIGQKYTQALGQSVYGGSYNWATGELTITAAHIASYNGEALPGMWRCDRADYAPGTTPPIGSEVVYELTQPQTVKLDDGRKITTIDGINNIWSSTGRTSAKTGAAVRTVNGKRPGADGGIEIGPEDIPGLEAYIMALIAAGTAGADAPDGTEAGA